MFESDIKKGMLKCMECALIVSTTINGLCVSCYLKENSLKKVEVAE